MIKSKIIIFFLVISILITSSKIIFSEQEYIYPSRTWGYIFLGISTISLGFGYYFNWQGSKDYDESLILYEEYKNAISDFDTKWNAYKDRYDSHESKFAYRNVLYTVSVLSLTYSIYAIFLNKVPKEEKISIRIYPDQISYTYIF